MLWRAEAVAWVCSVKKVFLKFSQYIHRKIPALEYVLTKLQIFSLQNFKSRFFKYTFGWLLLIKRWMSLKMAPIAIAINISNASYQREFAFFSYLRSAYGKFVEISKVYFCLLNSKEFKGTVFSSKLSFFFNRYLMLSFSSSQMET